MALPTNFGSIVTTGACFMLVGVVLGAFGAHGLKPIISEEQLMSYETGIRYLMYHGLGLLLLANLHNAFSVRQLRTVCTLITIGTLLFSGTIVLLATKELSGIGSLSSVLGPLTPIGGLCLIIAWALVILFSVRNRR